MADFPRKADGTPANWMPGGISVPHGQHELIVPAGASTFGRTPATGAPDKWAGDATYMPVPFVAGLPQLEDVPSKVIYRDPPITTLDDFSVEDIRGALRGHVIGQFLSSARLADTLTGDDRIASVLNARVKGMLGLPFICKPRAKNRGDEEAKTVSKQIARLWDRMCPRSQVAEFLQWGIQMGFALAEIIWKHRGGMWVPTIRTWHPQLVYYRYDERAFYVITMDGPVRVTPGDGKWILYAPHGEYRGWMHAIVRTCSAPWRYRTYALRDWARHAEKHGFPWVLARVPLNSQEKDKQAFYAALQNLGSEPTLMTPRVDENNAFDIDLKEAAHPAADVFEKLVQRCDVLISCAILGQNLTTEVQGGSYAAATVHGQVRQDFLEADARTLAQTLKLQLLRPFCIYNYEKGQKLVPDVAWDTTPPDDKKLTSETVRNFAQCIQQLSQAGFPLDVSAFAKQFGIPIDTDAQEQQGQLFKYHLDFGVATKNEIRARLGLPPMEDGDVAPNPLVKPGGFGEEATLLEEARAQQQVAPLDAPLDVMRELDRAQKMLGDIAAMVKKT